MHLLGEVLRAGLLRQQLRRAAISACCSRQCKPCVHVQLASIHSARLATTDEMHVDQQARILDFQDRHNHRQACINGVLQAHQVDYIL